VLDRLGVGDLPARCGAVPLGRLVLAAGQRSAAVPLAGGVALSRERLDDTLVERAIEAGAEFLPCTRASMDRLEAPDARRVRLERGEAVEVRARVVLAADGLGGPLLARAGLSASPPEPRARLGAGLTLGWDEPAFRPGTVYMACGRSGYLGLVRLEDGRLDIAAALDPAAVRASGGVGALTAELLREVGWPVPPADLAWKGTPPLTRAARRLAGHRVFALGDAAGYVEPFTGEGIAWALASAEAVAPLAAEAARRWHPALEGAWAGAYRRVVTRRQLACRAAAAVLRRPTLIRVAVRLLALAPGLAAPVVSFLNRPAGGRAAVPAVEGFP
jgi:flavin-dependent dehydrogenase